MSCRLTSRVLRVSAQLRTQLTRPLRMLPPLPQLVTLRPAQPTTWLRTTPRLLPSLAPRRMHLVRLRRTTRPSQPSLVRLHVCSTQRHHTTLR
jgi:hypothetical protein